MCKPLNNAVISSPSLEEKQILSRKNNVSLLWPVKPIYILIVAPFLPSWLYLSRGYTVWYNLTALVYVLTNIEPIRRFVIVQGIGVCAGWYAAMANDVIHHGRFAHILYMNMPSCMKTAMVDESGEVFYTYNSLVYMAISHALDTFLHPGIAYLLYKAHRRAGGTVEEIFSWKILAAAFVVSRLWSLVHIIHHNGKIGAWYFGYDIYHLNDLDCWMVAYVAESVAFACMVGYKILHRRNTNMQKTNKKAKEEAI
jgi:hypothetical protein